MKINVLQITLALLLLSSCGSDSPSNSGDQDPVLPTDKVLLLKDRSQDGIIQLSYSYNPDSTLQETISYDNEGVPKFKMSFQYIGNNIDSEVTLIETGEVTTTRKYYQQSDTESLREFYGSDGLLNSSSRYLFDGNACGYTDVISFDALGNALPNTRVEYIDENCSARFYSKFQDDDEYLQWEYTRTDKYDSSNSILLPFFKIEKQNAVTKLVRRTSDGTVSTNLSYDAVFEFNDYDHPIKETRTYLDGDIVEYAYSYYE